MQLYRGHIADQWADYIEILYQKGKLEWQYAIPSGSSDQQLLHSLCEQTLDFENHYFQRYRTYLLERLQGTDEERQFAAKRLTQTVYTDDEMLKALQTVARAAKHEESRNRATQALENIHRLRVNAGKL